MKTADANAAEAAAAAEQAKEEAVRAGQAFDASEAARAQAAQADVLRANGVLATPVPLPAAPAAPADEPPSAAAAAAPAAAAGASASPSPLPEHSDYYMCKMEGKRCEALTAAQRKDAGHPADADGQAQPAPGGASCDFDSFGPIRTRRTPPPRERLRC